MNRVSKILLSIILIIIGFGVSAFGIYKYNEIKVFNNLAGQGKQYMIEKNYDKAIQVFQQALIYKSDPDIKRNIALAQSLKNEESKKGVISKNIQLANDAAKNNKYDEANKYLDEILKIDSNNSEAKSLKDAYAKAVQDQQERANAEATNKKQESYRNVDSHSEAGITQQQAYEIVSNRFDDCDVFVGKKSDYADDSNNNVKQSLDKYYLFHTKYKFGRQMSGNLIGVDKKTGVIYTIGHGPTPIERMD